MAEFNISGRMTVGTLKKQFEDAYGLELRVFNGSIWADESATLASISDKKVDDFECRSHMKVGNFEERFKEATGVKVQVATRSDAKVEPGRLVHNESTLGEASKNFGGK